MEENIMKNIQDNINTECLSDKEAKHLKELFKKSLAAYKEKDAAQSDQEWLENLFVNEIANMDAVLARQDAEKIVTTISRFSENMKAIAQSEQGGTSKEAWLAKKLEQTQGMTDQEKGKAFSELSQCLYERNMELAGETEESDEVLMGEVIDEKEKDYQPFELKEMAMEIGRNASAMALQNVSVTLGSSLAEKILSNEVIEADELVYEALASGKEASLEVITSGILEVASKNKMLSSIPPDTASDVLANIACVGVKQAGILKRLALGEISLTMALQQVSRMGISVVANLWETAKITGMSLCLKGWVPILGPVMTVVPDFVGALAVGFAGKKLKTLVRDVRNKLASAAKTVARTAVQGLKRVADKVKSGYRKAKTFIKNIL